MSPSAMNLVEVLRRHAQAQGARTACVFLANGETESARLDYATLDNQARTLAAALQQRHAAGSRALLLYPEGPHFIAAFLGCLYAGIIAVPAPLPSPTRLGQAGDKLAALVADAGASVLLCEVRHRDALTDVAALAPLDVMASDALLAQAADDAADAWRMPALADDTLAYLQYTSGSTSTPKGVMIGHGNLLRHCERLRDAWGYDADSTAATWLPHFHDYGLVDGLLQPLHGGITVHVMAPVAFFARPLRWLSTISRERVTHSQAPNFGYEHCVERIRPEQCAGLDLSCWRTASNGAEPIAAGTLARFAAAFGACGFRPESLYPAYGLAEATLLVATKPHGTRARQCTLDAAALERDEVEPVAAGSDSDSDSARTRTLVSCGPPIGDTEVLIVDPQRRARTPAGRVGEVWVAGPALALGYWQRETESRETFAALLEPDGRGPFLRTGDLGFLQDGELYLTGRIKEVIIIRGRNHYPQDILRTVERSHAALRAGHGAAFGVNVEGSERLVVVQEVARHALAALDIARIVGDIRQAVTEQHDVQAHAVLLVRPGGVPKTSSGKIQHAVCRQRYLAGVLPLVEA